MRLSVHFHAKKKEVEAIAHGVSSAGSGIKYRLGTALLLACTHLFPPKNTYDWFSMFQRVREGCDVFCVV